MILYAYDILSTTKFNFLFITYETISVSSEHEAHNVLSGFLSFSKSADYIPENPAT